MKVRLVVEGDREVSIELGYKSLMNFMNNLHYEEDEDVQTLCEVLSDHPSSEIRETIAGMEVLPEKVVLKFLSDSSLRVVRNIVRSKASYEVATTEHLMEIIGRDTEAADTIADCLDDYVNVDTNKIFTLLVAHPDPQVREAAARNGGARKKHLKMLLNDPDLDVRRTANDSL
jgi:hypothetical protein